jgi:citrate lyase beta subunit
VTAPPAGLLAELTDAVDRRLAAADAALAAAYPDAPADRQPVHTVYVPADRYDAGTVPRWGAEAAAALDAHAPDAARLAAATGLDAGVVEEVHPRVLAKLGTEPVEDLRIDFEDGYGHRGDDEEDAAVDAAVQALAASVRDRTAAPFRGIRFKSLEASTRRRGLRTLTRFVAGLTDAGVPLDGFVVTLPKVTSVHQVEAMVLVCERLEEALGLARGAVAFELQIETPQAVLGADGTAPVAPMVHAAAGRCSGLHYGTYDYSAACGIAAAHQSLDHPAADHAKAVMQVAAAGTGVVVSDGSTNVLPVGDRIDVHAAWRLHARLVGRALARGLYQGWDLHPGHLPTRFLATYAFYRSGLGIAAARLKAYAEGAASGYLDEPATARALAGFVARGIECGAVDLDEASALTGMTREKIWSMREAT